MRSHSRLEGGVKREELSCTSRKLLLRRPKARRGLSIFLLFPEENKIRAFFLKGGGKIQRIFFYSSLKGIDSMVAEMRSSCRMKVSSTRHP